MREKLRQLERLKRLREIRERLSEASVAVAVGRLREAEQRLMEAKEAELAGARETIRAMEGGERAEWTLSLALRKAFRRDCARYEMECGERAVEVKAAREVLRACRIETEQAAVLQREAQEALAMEEERRAQAASADRFLARSRWEAGRAGVKSLIEAG